MNRNAKTFLDCFADLLFQGSIRTPLLHEIQNLVGALVRTPRTSATRQQAGDPLFRKRLLRRVVRLPTHPEGGRNLGHRVSIDLVAPQHFVTHLRQIARIEEFILTEYFIADVINMKTWVYLEPRPPTAMAFNDWWLKWDWGGSVWSWV